MKVQGINNDGTVVWEFDAEKRNDFSREWWNDPANHKLMAGTPAQHLNARAGLVGEDELCTFVPGHLRSILHVLRTRAAYHRV